MADERSCNRTHGVGVTVPRCELSCILELAGITGAGHQCAGGDRTDPGQGLEPLARFAAAMRACTKASRAVCKESTDCCSDDLIGTKRMFARETASQIA